MSAQRMEIPRATSYSMGSGREAKRRYTAKPLCVRELYDRIHCLGFNLSILINLGRGARVSHLPSEIAQMDCPRWAGPFEPLIRVGFHPRPSGQARLGGP
jgi:hypothetical protein